MTAIIAIRVNDGVILAADGRTLIQRNSDGEALVGFDQAGKIFPIRSRPPVAFAACGAGSVGGLSMRFLAAELMSSPKVQAEADLKRCLQEAAASIQQRSEAVVCASHNPRPDFTWLVGGYDGDAPLPSLWRMSVRHGRPQAPERLEQALVWAGEGAHAIDRLIGGVAPELAEIIRHEVSDRPTAGRLLQMLERLRLELVHPEMPLGDAVALARLLLDTAVGIERLRGAIPHAGGERCVALIDRHKGFRYLSGDPM